MELSAEGRQSEGEAQLAFAERDVEHARDWVEHVEKPSDLGEDLVLILGAPRSGTTWLAKIFDSHPGVVYRHEPETVLRSVDLPIVCRHAEADAYRDLARAYLSQLVAIRTLKTAGSLPIFAKEYRGRLRELQRRALIYGLHALSLLSGGSKGLHTFAIPDAFDPTRRPPLCTVVKSVSLLGRVGLIAGALPKSRIIFLLRHPCGQIASMLHGTRLGKFRKSRSEELLAFENSERLGLSLEALETMSLAEHHAWRWGLFCQKIVEDLRGRSNVRIVRYEALCAQPMQEAQALFAFAGLPWHNRTAAFIKASTNSAALGRYYGVMRNSKTAAYTWRAHFSAADQQRVLAITRQFEVGQYYPD